MSITVKRRCETLGCGKPADSRIKWHEGAPENVCRECGEGYSRRLGVTARADVQLGFYSDFGVSHIWTNVACPAYQSLNGADCTC